MVSVQASKVGHDPRRFASSRIVQPLSPGRLGLQVRRALGNAFVPDDEAWRGAPGEVAVVLARG